MYRVIISSLIMLAGLLLAIGGVWLISLGGDWTNFLIGIGLILSAVLLLSARPLGLGIYAMTVVLTLILAFREVGDGWALSARGSLLVIFAILLLPVAYDFLRLADRNTQDGCRDANSNSANSAALAGAIVLCGAAAGFALVSAPHERGALNSAELEAAIVVDEAVANGPLVQIARENLTRQGVAWTDRMGEPRSAKDRAEPIYRVMARVSDPTMYVCVLYSTVIALEAVIGVGKWRFALTTAKPPSI